ncbi:choline ABC transporter substrate-binding protein [Marinomonas sp. M1K-6]|uniref:Choline ABC transporter substrate-binding protein n=1 Tax=Marinomonas profundi TaxID=2726122 RepID=A0A847QZH1_9GAMM|nr:choline ABC transporter substrate-binding protein [Marinomonas profundi]NLQ16282.1 choline ABC transporter substrate-binding protein [Marinomonas profundi]UDV03142.1 choline ABC transporter substrate-binding protein [Marinomonas profundi]
MTVFPFNQKGLKALGVTSLLLSSSLGLAAEPEQCQKVTFSDPGWTDIGATNGIATTLLNAMGYDTQVYLLSVPVGFESLKNGEIDAFMGNWMPAQSAFIDKYKDNIEIVRTNLEGVKFTLAVPTYVFDAGVKDFSDLQKFSKDFRQRIYGIDAGAPANQKLQDMIDSNDFGLKEWNLVESGEQAMLSQVSRTVKRDNFIVFLAWEPHPMNVNFDLKYLTGGDEYFGPNYGGATIRTLTRKDYTNECPNVGKLLSNLKFSLTMENEIIGSSEKPEQAAENWIKAHPGVLDNWLQGVTTYNGEPALSVVKGQLGLM